MDIKPKPNHQRYLEVLRKMTPAQRLQRHVSSLISQNSYFAPDCAGDFLN